MKAAQLFDITGRVAVITGGATGLGLAYAQAMLDNGARVALMDRDATKLNETIAALAERGHRVLGHVVDVTDRSGVRKAFDAVVGTLGRLDIVFANAGIDAGAGFLTYGGQRSREGAIETIADDLWDKVMATNMTSVMTTIQAAVPHLKASGKGRIIVTSSIAGLRPGAIVGTPYIVSKAATAHLVKQAALELVRFGILVNAIVPGPFQTQLTTPELAEIFERGSPMHRVAHTDEIQGLALFLASDASSYVTGTHMVIDGGALLGRAD